MKFLRDAPVHFPAGNKYGQKMAVYECPKCKAEYTARVSTVKHGKTTMCLECSHKNNIRSHGLNRTPLHKIWMGMKSRCNNQNATDYDRYGAKGVCLCDEWNNNFVAFNDWAISNGYEEGLTIDRIISSGNYEPSNCRWADKYTQAQNKSKRKDGKFEYIGVLEYATKKGITFRTQISAFGKKITATFKNIEDAIMYRDTIILVYGLKQQLQYESFVRANAQKTIAKLGA